MSKSVSANANSGSIQVTTWCKYPGKLKTRRGLPTKRHHLGLYLLWVLAEHILYPALYHWHAFHSKTSHRVSVLDAVSAFQSSLDPKSLLVTSYDVSIHGHRKRTPHSIDFAFRSPSSGARPRISREPALLHALYVFLHSIVYIISLNRLPKLFQKYTN
jgi:hypothetical protein